MIKMEYSKFCLFFDNTKNVYKDLSCQLNIICNDSQKKMEYVQSKISEINNQISRFEKVIAKIKEKYDLIVEKVKEKEIIVEQCQAELNRALNTKIPEYHTDSEGNEYVVWVVDEAAVAAATKELEKATDDLNKEMEKARECRILYDDANSQCEKLVNISKACQYTKDNVINNSFINIKNKISEIGGITKSNCGKLESIDNVIREYLAINININDFGFK